MTTTVTIRDDELHVELHGIDKLWTLKSTLTIPLAHVRGATPDAGIAHDRAGIRLGGTRVPGVITAGTFRQDGETVFWDVHDPRNVLVIELRDETYARLVLEVDDPRATAHRIASAIS